MVTGHAAHSNRVTYIPSELHGIHVLVYQHAVQDLQIQFLFTFCLKLDGHQFCIPFQVRLFSHIYERGIQSLRPVGVQTVVGQVPHFLHACGFYTHIFQQLRVIRQGETEGIDRTQPLTGYPDFHRLPFIVHLL